MKVRQWLSAMALLSAVVLGVAGGISVAVLAGAVPAVAAFHGHILVSARGAGDSNETQLTPDSPPLFYTTAAQGQTSDGIMGLLPTGLWAPGDTWSRVLIIHNQHPMYVMGLDRLLVTLQDDSDMAPWYTLHIRGPGGHLLYQGRLSETAGTERPFSQPVVLRPGDSAALFFDVSLSPATPNPWQGKTVRADFEVRASPQTSHMMIDIKPNSWPNGLNIGANGTVPVAVNGSETFDVSILDGASARFGPGEAAPVRFAPEDWNRDGYTDLVLHFRTQETGLTCDDTVATMTIRSFEGVMFEGSDAVFPQPCP